jgi:hypothetical protein
MPNLMANATNFPRRINNYVPAMQYSADVNYNGETRVSFGAPLAVVANSHRERRQHRNSRAGGPQWCCSSH